MDIKNMVDDNERELSARFFLQDGSHVREARYYCFHVLLRFMREIISMMDEMKVYPPDESERLEKQYNDGIKEILAILTKLIEE